MNLDLGIKLQAYLDGELTEGEANQVKVLLDQDVNARALLGELQETRTLLQENEPEFRLSDSRDFYWSKIEREIERLEAAPARSATPAWRLFLRNHFAAVSGIAVAASVVLFMALQMNIVSPAMFEEIDNPLDDSPSFSFRSESQQMTLVWISNPYVDGDEAVDSTPEEIQ